MQTIDEGCAISETVADYFIGMYAGDTDLLQKMFHPAAHLFGYYRGTFCHRSFEDWIDEVASSAKPSESGEPLDMRILAIDMTSRIASVKAAVVYKGLRFTDYLTLMQVEGDWKIVSRAYHHD